MGFNLRGDRRDHPPFGVEGGGKGAPSAHILVSSDGAERLLPAMPMHAFAARAGEVFRLVGAGGGGFGDAFAREPARVLADVVEEKVSVAGAARDYGAVIDPATPSIDQSATQALRAGATQGAAE